MKDYLAHWTDGNRYALEGIRTVLLLNGGAAVALLAFWGNEKCKISVSAMQLSLIWFAVGAIFAALTFLGAHITQQAYGNSALLVEQRHDNAAEHQKALKYNRIALIVFAASLGAFLIGVLVAAKVIV